MPIKKDSYKTSGSKENQSSKLIKRGVMQRISAAISKVFKFLRYVIHFISELIVNAMQLLVFLFGYIVKLFAHPTTPCIVAILTFGAVVAIATAQWYLIGVWLGSFLKLSNLWGISAGVCGAAVGLGINIYQLAPQLWRLSKDVAQGYADLDIKPDMEGTDQENVNTRLGDWGSFGHQFLKRARITSYGIEAALVLGYCFSSGLNFFAIIQAAVSLLLPEKCLEWASSTYSVLGRVSEHIHGKEAPEVDNVQF